MQPLSAESMLQISLLRYCPDFSASQLQWRCLVAYMAAHSQILSSQSLSGHALTLLLVPHIDKPESCQALDLLVRH